jgi:CRP/FNR family transcriptional regulator
VLANNARGKKILFSILGQLPAKALWWRRQIITLPIKPLQPSCDLDARQSPRSSPALAVIVRYYPAEYTLNVMTGAPEHLPQLCGLDWSDAISRRCHDRQILFLEGDQKKWVYRVEAGAVCLYKIFPDGSRHILGFRFPNEVFGLGQAERYTHSAQSLGTTQLKCLDLEVLHTRAAHDASIALQLYHAASNKLEATRDLLLMLWQHNTIERTASFLVALAGKDGSSTPRMVVLPMNRAEAADFLNMKVETHSRALSKLCQLQLIEIRGRSEIYIKDLGGLQRLAAQTYVSNEAGERADAPPETPFFDEVGDLSRGRRH